MRDLVYKKNYRKRSGIQLKLPRVQTMLFFKSTKLFIKVIFYFSSLESHMQQRNQRNTFLYICIRPQIHQG